MSDRHWRDSADRFPPMRPANCAGSHSQDARRITADPSVLMCVGARGPSPANPMQRNNTR